MKKGICCAGNILVDITYPIETWPRQSELTHITEGICHTTGGAVCNTVVDLARLDPTLHLVASGAVGYDPEGELVMEEFGKYKNIDLSMIRRTGRTSFTAVMSNNQTKERTFFQYAGANAQYDETYIDWDKLDVNLFHIGYILLLPALDREDPEYGTAMARLLHEAQQRGFKTSIDVVSEAGDRFRRLVTPALRYTDYCIINELEAQQTTGVVLRDDAGTLHPEHMETALRALFDLGRHPLSGDGLRPGCGGNVPPGPQPDAAQGLHSGYRGCGRRLLRRHPLRCGDGHGVGCGTEAGRLYGGGVSEPSRRVRWRWHGGRGHETV